MYDKKEVTLYLTNTASNKEYRIIQERVGTTVPPLYIVYAMSGRRGSATSRQAKITVPTSESHATDAFYSLIKEKTSKGYTSEVSGKPHDGFKSAHIHETKSIAATPVAAAVSTGPEKTIWDWKTGSIDDSEKELETFITSPTVFLSIIPLGFHAIFDCWTPNSWKFLEEIGSFDKISIPKYLINPSKKLPKAHIYDLFKNYYLECVLDTKNKELIILDGFESKPVDVGGEPVYSSRLQHLKKFIKDLDLTNVKVATVYEDVLEKEEAMYYFLNNSKGMKKSNLSILCRNKNLDRPSFVRNSKEKSKLITF